MPKNIHETDEIRNIIHDWINIKGKLEWINFTYINSWEDVGSAGIIGCQYAKDVFGRVYFRGRCKNGITANPFVVPENYRPSYNYVIPIMSANYVTDTAYIAITTEGIVTFYIYSNTWVSIDGVSYSTI